MSNIDFLKRTAVTETAVEKTYTVDGVTETFTLARIRDLGEYTEIHKRYSKREAMLTKAKDGLLVSVPAETASQLAELLPDMKIAADGKGELRLKSKEEIFTATRLEMGLVEPKLSWAEAVIFQKLNFQFASKVVADFMILNGENAEEAVDAAKKDSTKTDDAEESEP